MSVDILITGDYCPVGRNETAIEAGDYTSFFGNFIDVVKHVDYAVTNLESPITNSTTKILKSGPNIKGHVQGVKPLKRIGFNMVTLANNHILDYGEQGVIDTITSCKKEEIDVVGAGRNIEDARKIAFKEIKNKKFAFINIAENEFCAATRDRYGANPLHLINNYYDIANAKKNADYVIIIAHGGREHYQLPTPNVRERYRFFIDCGADVVVGHHPHCYSGYESYKEKKIFYSLGNFIFDYKPKYQKGHWTEGMAVVLKFSELGLNFELIPFFQGRGKQQELVLMAGEDLERFNSTIKKLNEIIIDDDKLMSSWSDYIETQKTLYKSSLFVRNKYLRGLMIKGIIPAVFTQKKEYKGLVLNLFRCETHKEIICNILEKELYLSSSHKCNTNI